MHGSNGLARSKPNLWVALAGAALVLALAIGLILGGGADAQTAAGGYGGGGGRGGTGNGNPAAQCGESGGYATPCPPQISSLSNDPAKPKKGKGFKVSFKSKSGGGYQVSVVRNGKTTVLEEGGTGVGKTTTKKVGKKLKAGKYQLRASMSTGIQGAKPDVAKKSLKIRK
jgi:hypothetical protein